MRVYHTITRNYFEIVQGLEKNTNGIWDLFLS